MKANEFFKKVGVDAVKSYLAAYEDDLTNDLKRLVESHELVKSFGGLEKAMDAVINQEANGRPTNQLAQAIADVESCMVVASESN